MASPGFEVLFDEFVNAVDKVSVIDDPFAGGSTPSGQGPCCFLEAYDALPTHAQFLENIFRYPALEVTYVGRFLALYRQAIDAALHAMSPTDVLPSAAGGNNSEVVQGEDLLHTEYRAERIAILRRRIENFWAEFVPETVSAIEALTDDAKEAVADSNPFDFPAGALQVIDSFGDAPRVDERSAVTDGATPLRDTCGGRTFDLEALGATELFRCFRDVTVNFRKTWEVQAGVFEQTRVGAEGKDLEGAMYHGGLHEVRQAWKRMTTMADEFRSFGMILRNAMMAKRRERALMITLFERGVFDDALIEEPSPEPIEVEGTVDQLYSNMPLAFTATTRLQMARLGRLIATCRALDPSAAESALKKIQFEADRRQSVTIGTIAAASSSLKLQGGFTLGSPSSPSQRSQRKQSSAIAFADDSNEESKLLVSPPPEANDSTTPTPSAVSGRRGSLSASALVRMGSISASSTADASQGSSATRSIIPLTTLTDLEMIARAYSIPIRTCQVPRNPEDCGNTEPTVCPAVMAVQRNRRHFPPPGSAYAKQRLKELYGEKRRDVALMTEECAVIHRSDVCCQTALTGCVFEESLVLDYEHELIRTRTELSEKTQQLMLERQRCEMLLKELEAITRLRQERSRRSAAAGGELSGSSAATAEVTSSAPSPSEQSPQRQADSDDHRSSEGNGDASAMDRMLLASSEAERRAKFGTPQRRQLPSLRTTTLASGSRSPEAKATSPVRASSADASKEAPHGSDAGGIVVGSRVVRCFTLKGKGSNQSGDKGVAISFTPTPESTDPVDSLQAVVGVPTASKIVRRPHSSVSGNNMTLEREFGKPLANKMKALKAHNRQLLQVHRVEDTWSGETVPESVVVPLGIDPRHARRVIPPPEPSNWTNHNNLSIHEAPVGAPARRTLIATRYGTVSQEKSSI